MFYSVFSPNEQDLGNITSFVNLIYHNTDLVPSYIHEVSGTDYKRWRLVDKFLK